MLASVHINHRLIEGFCHRWKISGMSFFGSVLRDDFRPDSDIDVLVSFNEDADWSLLDHASMKEELSEILGRKADIVTRRAIEHSRNWIRKNAILSTTEQIYAA